MKNNNKDNWRKEVETEIKKRLNSDERSINTNFELPYKLTSIISGMLSGVLLDSFVREIIKVKTFDLNIFIKLLSFILALAVSYISYLHYVKIEKKEQEKTLWKYGKRIYLLLLIIGVTFFLLVILDKSYNLRFFGYALALNFLIISFFSLYTVYNLKLLLNRTFTKSISILTASIPILIALSSYEYTLIFPQHSTYIVILIIFFFGYLKVLKVFQKKSNLNTFQISIIKFVLPERILNEFASFNDKIKMEIEALKILDNLPKSKKVIIEKYLLAKLTEKYSSPISKFYTALYSVLLFLFISILSALIEFITFDTFYNPILKDILCKYLNCK